MFVCTFNKNVYIASVFRKSDIEKQGEVQNINFKINKSNHRLYFKTPFITRQIIFPH